MYTCIYCIYLRVNQVMHKTKYVNEQKKPYTDHAQVLQHLGVNQVMHEMKYVNEQ